VPVNPIHAIAKYLIDPTGAVVSASNAFWLIGGINVNFLFKMSVRF